VYFLKYTPNMRRRSINEVEKMTRQDAINKVLNMSNNELLDIWNNSIVDYENYFEIFDKNDFRQIYKAAFSPSEFKEIANASPLYSRDDDYFRVRWGRIESANGVISLIDFNAVVEWVISKDI